jgi:DNA excision repair protein ERCC-2
MKTIKLAVTDFGQRNILIGDIDDRASVANVAVELGAEIHREIQKSRHEEFSSYASESPVDLVIPVGPEFSLAISGRIDGMWTDADGSVVEEIKSSLKVRKTLAQMIDDPEHPYILQVKLYAWMTWKQRGVLPRTHILLVAAASREKIVFPVEFDPEEFSQWVDQRAQWIAKTWAENQVFKAARKSLAKNLKFPFAKKRDGQKALLEDVSLACKENKQLLAQAPTGLGKTAAVIFPMLKSALRRGDKLFYVTPKNSQLREAEKFLVKLHRKDFAVTGLIMTAKPKICMQDKVHCSPEVCRFAKGHYDKVNAGDLIELLKAEPLINQKLLRSYAEKYEVCPYELGKQVMPWKDVIAGDYHYALSPQASLRETSALPLVKDPKPLLAVDEAHNLAERSLDWYTATVQEISVEVIQKASRKLKKNLKNINRWLDEHLVKVSKNHPILQTLHRESLEILMEKWSAEMTEILENLEGPPDSDPLVSVWFTWLNFAELAKLPEELFFASGAPEDRSVTLHCVNAGPLLREVLSKFRTTVAFSATLKPFAFHKAMCGFDEERVVTKEFDSPFPPGNRCLIAIPQVSTAWKDRPRSTPRIAEVIERVTATRRGNYIAFFPSFDLMRQTKPMIKAEGFEIVEQPPKAPQSWVKDMMATFKNRRNILLLAVQGGVLSEGIDLPGEALIGTFVIGPALSMVTPEREERRRLLGAAGGDGFAKAYIYPAMARSIQSAGRVLRTPHDRGVIVLMDPRFLQKPYSDSFPTDWLSDNGTPQDLVSSSILVDIHRFWDQ